MASRTQPLIWPLARVLMRFIVRADELLTAFLELESAIRAAERPGDCGGREIKLDRLPR